MSNRKLTPQEWGLEQALQAPAWSDRLWLQACATLGIMTGLPGASQNTSEHLAPDCSLLTHTPRPNATHPVIPCSTRDYPIPTYPI